MKAFTLDYILNNMGCYVNEKEAYITKLFNAKQKQRHVSIVDLFEEKQIPFKDRCWFLVNSCGLSKKQQIELSIGWAQIVLIVYEDYNKEDLRPRKAIEAAKEYLKTRNADAAAAAAADAADAAYAADAADAAYTAVYAAYTAVYAAYTAADADAAYAAYTAADAAYDVGLHDSLESFTLEFIKNNFL